MCYESNPAGPAALLIKIPPKIWRPKPPCNFQGEDCYKDIDEDIFVFKKYGRCLAKPKLDYQVLREDIITWDGQKHQREFDKLITIRQDLDKNIATSLTNIIKRNWDAFSPEGVLKTVLGYEFCIDTGTAIPDACKQVPYGVHKSNIIMTEVKELF
jgi:hypothetical protein